jgi:eukaryotic-like serine/threonine-protein kinase
MSNYWQWRQLVAAQRSRAYDQVDSLLSVAPDSVPIIIDSLRPFRRDVEPRLRRLLKSIRSGPGERARIRLALLPDDPSMVDELRRNLLEVGPRELELIRDALLPFSARLRDDLWGCVAAPTEDADVRFRAACALAAFDPDSPRWKALSREIT